jgi:hypothetical protein
MLCQRERSGCLFSYVSIEGRIPASHPLRRIRRLADYALDRLTPLCELYAAFSAARGAAPGLAAAGVLRHSLGAVAVEQFNYNLLFRWFVGLSPNDPIWHPQGSLEVKQNSVPEPVLASPAVPEAP